MNANEVEFPDVHVQLSGEDGNVFSIIGRVTKALKRVGEYDAATQFANDAMDCPSYDDVLQLVMRTVETS